MKNTDKELRQQIKVTIENNAAVDIDMALFESALDELVALFHRYHSQSVKPLEPLDRVQWIDDSIPPIERDDILGRKVNEVIEYLIQKDNL